ncbi:uncharacterized protein J7T54_001393 [Emericellopsis cladophorae]|uniref:Uncharacterized protein n=1 Tax=Emericellopsis cladophorae TaxID=2686198 RepID=A0A9Q0BB82_9HYPO|nr:uncharacterized protein J7T54_001393 [Emericellopsis cladophorae]KAI6777784.1 hypothetical protein J7T54_001393 [Emericellopsis cladophorae]
MKIAITLASALLLGLTNAGTIGRNAPGRDPYARSVMMTFMYGPNIAESLQGQFSIKDVQMFAHTFNPACKHISTVEFEPKGGGNGCSAEIDIGVETVEATADCIGCEGGRIGYPGVFNVYAYKMCEIHYY